MPSSIGAAHASAHALANQALNPAKHAKAAEPAVKGKEFGHLVAQFAKARHAPETTDVAAPVETVTTPPADATETTGATGTVVDTTA